MNIRRMIEARKEEEVSSWHTQQEREVIRQHGGTPLKQYGPDGTINGRPVEVRSVKKDNRYRIQKDTHQTLLRGQGSYIFVDKQGNSTKVLASKVDKKLKGTKWFKDRSYPHKFINVKDIWR